MNAIETILKQPLVEALGWALIHFIWQGALVAILLSTAMSLIKRRAAEARYAVACAAMLLMLALPVTTAALVRSSLPSEAALTSTTPTQPVETRGRPPGQTEAAPLESSHPWRERLTERIAGGMPLLISIWLIGVLLLSLRLLSGCLSVERLKRRQTRPVAQAWQDTLENLCALLGVRWPVGLFESALVQVPMAVGWLRPIILLPTSALVGLTPQQLEALLAHELAHIRRHDYLVNLLQRVAEVLLFYHPAVWWVSRQVRIEREHCCDDLAVAACVDALVYARALAEMEGLRSASPQLALAADGGLLVSRIRRLVSVQTQRSNHFTGPLASLFVVIFAVTVLAGTQSSSVINLIDNAYSTQDQVVASQQQNSRAFDGLNDKSWKVRKAAVEALGQTGDSRAVELLLAALNDERWEVREQAAIILGSKRDERAVEQLISILTDKAWQVREQAARALGSEGNGRAVEPLIEALKDEHPQVREAAAKSLGQIGDRRAIDPLTSALRDVDEQVRKKAAEALGRISNGGYRGGILEDESSEKTAGPRNV